jgi:hypothetical protein
MMTPAEYHEEYRKFYGITGERWNDLTLMDKRFPWSVHRGVIVFLMMLTSIAWVGRYYGAPVSIGARLASELGVLLPGLAMVVLACVLMVRAVGVCWWYLSTRAQRDLVTVLKRRHERVLDRRMIAQMTPRDFEGDRKR